jgi:hypothetical protein
MENKTFVNGAINKRKKPIFIFSIKYIFHSKNAPSHAIYFSKYCKKVT